MTTVRISVSSTIAMRTFRTRSAPITTTATIAALVGTVRGIFSTAILWRPGRSIVVVPAAASTAIVITVLFTTAAARAGRRMTVSISIIIVLVIVTMLWIIVTTPAPTALAPAAAIVGPVTSSRSYTGNAASRTIGGVASIVRMMMVVWMLVGRV